MTHDKDFFLRLAATHNQLAQFPGTGVVSQPIDVTDYQEIPSDR